MYHGHGYYAKCSIGYIKTCPKLRFSVDKVMSSLDHSILPHSTHPDKSLEHRLLNRPQTLLQVQLQSSSKSRFQDNNDTPKRQHVETRLLPCWVFDGNRG